MYYFAGKTRNLREPLSEDHCKEIYDLSQSSTYGDLDTNERILDPQQRERDETVEKGLREGKRIFRLKD